MRERRLGIAPFRGVISVNEEEMERVEILNSIILVAWNWWSQLVEILWRRDLQLDSVGRHRSMVNTVDENKVCVYIYIYL